MSPDQDLDETRRLLYMALYANRTGRYELVATLVNALAHHHNQPMISASESAPRLLRLVTGWERVEDVQWLREQIDIISTILDDHAPGESATGAEPSQPA